MASGESGENPREVPGRVTIKRGGAQVRRPSKELPNQGEFGEGARGTT